MRSYVFLFLCVTLACMSPSEPVFPPDVYPVYRLEQNTLQIDGSGNDPAWERAYVLNDFRYPWREEIAPATVFRALWDDAYLYFLYQVTDPDIYLHQDSSLSLKQQAVRSDRIEIFFKADDAMDPYYSLEMDALGRIFDSEGRFYRKINADWTWPEGQLLVKASRDAGRYRVEGQISLSSLRQLGMLSGDETELKAGLYRGEYVRLANGAQEVKWISWIMPDSDKPDFHIPSSFGHLRLMR